MFKLLQLETNRLYFKRYSDTDLPFVTELVTNPHVMQFIGDGIHKTEEYARELIKRMLEQYENFGDYGLHLLIDKETKAYIGHAGIVVQIIDHAFELEIGYWIHPHYWGKGYGKEAAQALAQYADEELELERYVAAVQIGNIGSQKIAQAMGMHVEKVIEMDGKQVQIFVKENHFNHTDDNI